MCSHRSFAAALLATVLALACTLASVAFAADGALDPSFDGDGRLISDLTDRNDIPSDVVIDAQGRIVVAANSSNSPNPPVALVARYNADGSLDRSFGGDGVVTIGWSAEGEGVNGVAIDSQGRIVVGGDAEVAGQSDFAVARLLPSGFPDNGFDGDGRQTFESGGELDFGEDIAVDAEDRVLLAGQATEAGEDLLILLRFTSQGEPDDSFSVDGLVASDFGEGAFGRGVAIDASGRIVVAGGARIGGNDLFAAVRFTSAGLPDGSFDGDSRATVDFGSQVTERAEDLAIDPQGRILLAGAAGNAAEKVGHVARLDPNGSPDAGFDGDGKVTIAMSEPVLLTGVAVDGSGRIVLVGGISGPASSDALLARLLPGGGFDPAFGSGGFLREDYLAPSAGGTALAIDPAGRYLITGGALVPPFTSIGLARFLPSSPQIVPVKVEERMSCAGQTATIEGTGKRDVLKGTSRRDVIVALGGNDKITALGGNDLVCAGAGRDFVQAGRGNDRVLGGAGADRILGGAGVDTLLGEGGVDLLSGGPARDKLRGGAGRDDQRQ